MSRMLGRYELLEQLGEGGMGAVFLARLVGVAGFEKLCIVKTVLPSIAKDQEFVSRFLHEGRVLTQLSHGNIAQVLDLDQVEGTYFLALEYVAGVDLSRLVEQVRGASEVMPLGMAVLVAAQAAEGLGAAHRKAALDGSPLNIVHRDVSPHNVMVSYEGEVKVIDFGIAKSEARSRHTAQASVMGKLGYMAPEQARGEPVDHRADQYALGIVLWELLSNQSFIPRGTLTEMVVAMASPAVRPLAPLRADVPPSLEAVVLRALSPDRERRFETTDAFAQALLAELAKLPGAPTKPQLGEYVRVKCAGDYAAQRQLLTRVTTQRTVPPAEAVPLDVGLADTALRPGPPLPTLPGVPGLGSTQPTLPGRGALATPAMAEGLTSPGGGGLQHASTRPSAAAVAPSPQPLTAPLPAITPLDRPAPVVPQAALPASEAPTAPLERPAVPPAFTTGELRAAKPSKVPLLVIIVLLLAMAVLATWNLGGGGKDGTSSPPVAAVTPPTPAPVEPALPPTEVAHDAGATEPSTPPAGELGAAEPQDAGVEAPPPPIDEQPTLRLVARRTPESWILSNRNQTTWTGCTMTVPGQRVAKLGTVVKGSSREVAFRQFVRDPAALPLQGQARVDCEQGFGLVKAP